MSVYIKLSTLFPPKIRQKYAQQIIYADLEINEHVYVGFSLFSSIVAGFIAFFALGILDVTAVPAVVLSILAGACMLVFFYALLLLLSESRSRKIEQTLPDALQLMAANIRAGMTIDKALWLSARPELGVFEKEIRRMASATLAGKNITIAMKESAERVDSVMLQRAVTLLIQGIELGGEIAHLLNEISLEIRTEQMLRKEVAATTAMYSLFIVFAAVIAAPILFGVSNFYVQSTTKLWGSQAAGQTENLPGPEMFKMSRTMISASDVGNFSLSCLFVTNFFSGLIIGIIKTGKMINGLKYIPVFVIAALSIHLIALSMIRTMFSALI